MSYPSIVNPSQLNTQAGVAGTFEYVVNIQKRGPFPDHLSYAVGVLVHVQWVLSACSVFENDVNKRISPEEKKYKLYRIVADGVLGHEQLALDGRKIRFIDKVTLHSQCEKPVPPTTNRWRFDVAMAHTSFPFDLQPGVVGIMKFGWVEGGAAQLETNRTRRFQLMFNQQVSVRQLTAASPVCRVVSWGRSVNIREPLTMLTIQMKACPRLLLHKIKLSEPDFCQVFCQQDDRFCNFTHSRASVVCAFRGNNTFTYLGGDYSRFPCLGAVGAPLICHPANRPDESDIYGIIAHVPESGCLHKYLPLTILRIDVVSKFVVEVVGKATTTAEVTLVLASSALLSLHSVLNL